MIFRIVYHPRSRFSRRSVKPGAPLKRAVHLNDGGGTATALYRLCSNSKPAANHTLFATEVGEATCERCKDAVVRRGIHLLKDQDLDMKFSPLLTDTAIGRVIRDGILQRAYHYAVFPKLLYKPKDK